MSTLAGALVHLATGLLAVVGVVPGGIATAPPGTEDEVFVHVCDQDAPEGWEVIEEASTLGERFVQCNYRIGGDTAGAAISIEYFCTAAEATSIYDGKVGFPRDTEVSRTSTKVVTEEGSAAGTEAGRQARAVIFSNFFPGVEFTLQQQGFLQLNSQTLATVVINTNSRAVTVDAVGQAAAIVVAANHTPAPAPGCEITPVADVSGGGEEGGAGVPGSGRKGGAGRIGIVLGGGAAVAIGGAVVWRRGKKPGRVVPKGDVGHVPPQCVGQHHAFERVRERVLILQEAHADMAEQLQKAERIQHHNTLRTIAILGIDAGTTIGGAVSAATRLRPSARRPSVAQADTWMPPANLDPRLADFLRRAEAAAAAAAARLAAARRRLAELTAQLGQVGNSPSVRAARDRVAALGAAVERATGNLAGSKAARAAIDRLDGTIDKVSAAAAANAERVAGLERMLERQQGWLAGATDDLAKLTDTVDGGTTGQRLGPVDPRVQRKAADLERIRADMQKTTAELADARLNSTETTRNLEQLVGERDAHMRDLAKHGDVMDADVDRLRREHAAAQTAADTAQLQASSALDADVRRARADAARAEMESSLADSFAKNAAWEAQLRAATPPPGLARRALHGLAGAASLPFLPALWLFEKGFGSVQSTPEAVEILIRGHERIDEMTRHLTMVERAVTQQRTEVQRLRQVLAACQQQWSGAA